MAPGACLGPSTGLSLCPELVPAALTAIVVSELPVCVCVLNARPFRRLSSPEAEGV